jgi:predicted DNA-binding transcriptional regulator AlpA
VELGRFDLESDDPYDPSDEDEEPGELAQWDFDDVDGGEDGDVLEDWLDRRLAENRNLLEGDNGPGDRDRDDPDGDNQLPETGPVLRRPAPARVVRRRRADPSASADLPAATVPGYYRDRRGTWRYAITGDAVPGARDLTLRSLYRFPRRTGTVFVPLLAARTEVELGWCLDFASAGLATTRAGPGRGFAVALRVPAGEWDRHADVPFGMCAPELDPRRLLDSDAVAALAGVTRATVAAYLARQLMPPPVSRVGNSPVWTRPVIRAWLATRPGRGGRRRTGVPATGVRRPTPP